MARFFENSLGELASGNDGIEGDFPRIDADRFAAVVYKQGQAVSRCTVFLGDRTFAGGIAYSASETSASNGYDELLTVESDDQSMFLRSMGMAARGGGREAVKLTQEGAAEAIRAISLVSSWFAGSIHQILESKACRRVNRSIQEPSTGNLILPHRMADHCINIDAIEIQCNCLSAVKQTRIPYL